MANIQKILQYRKHLKLAAVIISIIIIYLFTSASNSINSTVENLFHKALGKTVPDSNIVIIHINENDIEKLGGWPLKRSYYALLINRLNQLNVKSIGIEVFLSGSYSFQSVYNDLVNTEIKKSGNVILGSLISNLHYNGDFFTADSIIYPQPKLSNPNIKTGHLNYQSGNGIYIPEKLFISDIEERAFSSAIAEYVNDKINIPDFLKINFSTSWKDFKNISLLEFFNLVETNGSLIKSFKDKIILVGVSDLSTAKFVTTTFDKNLPGVGLHAIALNNILTGNYLIYRYKTVSSILFILLFAVLAYFEFSRKDMLCCAFALIVCFAVSFVLFSFFNIELNYAAFLVPFTLLVLMEAAFHLMEDKFLLSVTISEAEILRRTLEKKEESLRRFESELNKSNNSPSQDLLNSIENLKEEITRLKESREDDIAAEPEMLTVSNFHGIIYKSKEMNEVVKTIEKIAPTDASILILGESGSGKELAANAIHKLSKRSGEKFLAINCAALTDSLLESELFGHVKGAFTNAVYDKKGMFEAADKGTIFLDEIGETSENFQVKLLRVLQSGEIQKVGDTNNMHVDVRVVAATNKDLEELVKEKKFREDLYYRLNVIGIKLPPLRDRKEDIEILADKFAANESESLKISKAVLSSLYNYDWKGNVRELESVIKRASIFAKSENRDIIKLGDLPKEMAVHDKSHLENLILDSLREKEFSHSSINETAKELGDLSRTIISENFRGIFFKYYTETEFNLDEAVIKIADSTNDKIIDKVKSKASTYLRNIEKDLQNQSIKDFNSIKNTFSSKYKNLPQKYHKYLDAIIKNIIQ